MKGRTDGTVRLHNKTRALVGFVTFDPLLHMQFRKVTTYWIIKKHSWLINTDFKMPCLMFLHLFRHSNTWARRVIVPYLTMIELHFTAILLKDNTCWVKGCWLLLIHWCSGQGLIKWYDFFHNECCEMHHLILGCSLGSDKSPLSL